MFYNNQSSLHFRYINQLVLATRAHGQIEDGTAIVSPSPLMHTMMLSLNQEVQVKGLIYSSTTKAWRESTEELMMIVQITEM